MPPVNHPDRLAGGSVRDHLLQRLRVRAVHARIRVRASRRRRSSFCTSSSRRVSRLEYRSITPARTSTRTGAISETPATAVPARRRTARAPAPRGVVARGERRGAAASAAARATAKMCARRRYRAALRVPQRRRRWRRRGRRRGPRHRLTRRWTARVVRYSPRVSAPLAGIASKVTEVRSSPRVALRRDDKRPSRVPAWRRRAPPSAQRLPARCARAWVASHSPRHQLLMRAAEHERLGAAATPPRTPRSTRRRLPDLRGCSPPARRGRTSPRRQEVRVFVRQHATRPVRQNARDELERAAARSSFRGGLSSASPARARERAALGRAHQGAVDDRRNDAQDADAHSHEREERRVRRGGSASRDATRRSAGAKTGGDGRDDRESSTCSFARRRADRHKTQGTLVTSSPRPHRARHDGAHAEAAGSPPRVERQIFVEIRPDLRRSG